MRVLNRLLTPGFYLVPIFALASEVQVPPLPTLASLPPSLASEIKPVADQPVPYVPVQPMVQHSKGTSLDLRFATVAFVVDFVYENAVRTPHVIEPDVLADQRQVSFRYRADSGDLRDFLSNFLDSLGYGVTTKDGVDFIGKKLELQQPREDRVPFVYTPRYRKADYLMRMVQPLVGGRFTTQRTVSPVASAVKIAASGAGEIAQDVPAQSAAAQIDQTSDQLVFLGTHAEVAALQKVLPMIDTLRGKVNLRAWVYEVTDSSGEQSGFSLAVKLLGSSLGVNNGFTAGTASSVVLHAGNAINVAIQALDSDSHFHVLTRPNVSVLSGERARLKVGQQVPTYGNVSYSGVSGTPVQSVVYQDAGVIFDVQPVVMDSAIEMTVDTEISDFVNTNTGVDNSPTKNTRQLQTVTDMQDGDIAVIGGLLQSHTTTSTSGLSFLPRWMKGQNNSNNNTEIVLVLQVDKIYR